MAASRLATDIGCFVGKKRLNARGVVLPRRGDFAAAMADFDAAREVEGGAYKRALISAASTKSWATTTRPLRVKKPRFLPTQSFVSR